MTQESRRAPLSPPEQYCKQDLVFSIRKVVCAVFDVEQSPDPAWAEKSNMRWNMAVILQRVKGRWPGWGFQAGIGSLSKLISCFGRLGPSGT